MIHRMWLMPSVTLISLSFCHKIKRINSPSYRRGPANLHQEFTRESNATIDCWLVSDESSWVLVSSTVSVSLSSPSSSSLRSESLQAEWSKLCTALFAVSPSDKALPFKNSLQIWHTLTSGRLHSRWKECPQPWNTRHKVLSRLQPILSHLLFQRVWKVL